MPTCYGTFSDCGTPESGHSTQLCIYVSRVPSLVVYLCFLMRGDEGAVVGPLVVL